MILEVDADCMTLPLKSEKQPDYVKRPIPAKIYISPILNISFLTLNAQATGNYNYRNKKNGTASPHKLIMS